MDNQASNFEQLAEALQGHDVTDDNGDIAEGTTASGEPAAPADQTALEESASPEKGTDSEPAAPQAAAEEDAELLAEDDKGRKYVPEKRFKQVYGQAKQLEREIAELRKQAAAPSPIGHQNASQPAQQNPAPIEKADLLELELLRQTLPQFDPGSDQYDEELDMMGAEIFKANPGITKLDAARRAVARQRKFAQKEALVRVEARAVKAQQADSGITSRVASRNTGDGAPGEGASLEEMEAYLRRTGQW